MKYILPVFFSFFMLSCQVTGQQSNAQELAPKQFQEQIVSNPDVQILDVRTPKEFSGGHLENALNADWMGKTFDQDIRTLDKTKPVYVYCLSGGRSSEAARKLKSLGFTEVHDMKGGMLAWRAANLPEAGKELAANTDPGAQANGLTMEQFKDLLSEDKLVLVDFHAEWCGPCKKMAPYLDQIGKEMKDKVVILRIDADDNEELANQMNIVGLPNLQIYKKKEQVWQHMGYMTKGQLESAIKKQL